MMNSPSQTVVVGVDGSPGSDQAVRWAAEGTAQRNLRLHIVHAMRGVEMYYGAGLAGPTSLFDAVQREGEKIVRDSVRLANSVAEKVPVTTDLRSEPPASLLIELSRTARMVVVGRSGSGGFAGMLVGSTAAAVVSHAHCPVAVVRARRTVAEVPDTGPVVVGIDGSPTSEQAIAVAFEEASLRGVPLIALHAWSDITYDDMYGTAGFVAEWESIQEGEQRLLAQRLAGWQEKYPNVDVQRRLVRDRPRHALLDESEKAQLVVVGSRGRGGFRGMLLGSTSQALVHYAQCPVLVVRPESGK
jgi:nucleotide-binding universal stress UspA family protein